MGVAWYRLRYRDAAGPARCLRLLASSQACGRVAVRYWLEQGENQQVAHLYVGVPEPYRPLLYEMAMDFGFSITAEDPALVYTGPLTAATDLPWERQFAAHLVGDNLFVSCEAGGSYFPAPGGAPAVEWTLPQTPPLGMKMAAAWPQTVPPSELCLSEARPDRWLLGRHLSGQMLTAAGRVNLYGMGAADWLVFQLTQTIAAGHGRLAVLDGSGVLGPWLKRQAAVTRLLGRGLTYIDIDGGAVDGFDPLAAVPGETEEGRRARRTTWFRLMGVHKAGLALLTQAPLTDLTGLQKWLAAPAQQRQGVAAGALEGAINQLMADRRVRQWLEWPADRYAGLPEGVLIFSCKGMVWAQQQLLVAALLAALAAPGMRLALHRLPWEQRELEEELELELEEEGETGGRGEGGTKRAVLVSNGPLLAGSLPVLTATWPQHAARLARRFLGDDPVLTEHLRLLTPGDAVVCHESGLYPTCWTARKEGGHE